jgi:hypothetical protein
MDFLYLGPSTADYRKALECDVWFKGNISGEHKNEIEKLVPYPLVLKHWYGNLLHCATYDQFSQEARAGYGNRLKRVRASFGGMYTLANPAGLVEFHKLLDGNLSDMHRIHPILFFLKPGSDLYDEKDSNVKEVYSEWHRQSISGIETDIVPALTRYFLDDQITKEEKAHAVWVAEGLFEYVPKNIGRDYAQKLSALVKAGMGYSSYIDNRLKDILVKLEILSS